MLRLVEGVEIMMFKHIVVEEFLIAKPLRELVVCTCFDPCDEWKVNAMRTGRSVELWLTETLTMKEPQLAPEDDQFRPTTRRSIAVNSNLELRVVLDHGLALARQLGTCNEVAACQFFFQGHIRMSLLLPCPAMSRTLESWWVQQPGQMGSNPSDDADGGGEMASSTIGNGSSSSTDISIGEFIGESLREGEGGESESETHDSD